MNTPPTVDEFLQKTFAQLNAVLEEKLDLRPKVLKTIPLIQAADKEAQSLFDKPTYHKVARHLQEAVVRVVKGEQVSLPEEKI